VLLIVPSSATWLLMQNSVVPSRPSTALATYSQLSSLFSASRRRKTKCRMDSCCSSRATKLGRQQPAVYTIPRAIRLLLTRSYGIFDTTLPTPSIWNNAYLMVDALCTPEAAVLHPHRYNILSADSVSESMTCCRRRR